MHAAPILQYLKKNGQRMDMEIAEATGIPLSKVRLSLSDLSARGEISRCSVTRYTEGKPIEGMLVMSTGPFLFVVTTIRTKCVMTRTMAS
jgi:hypothetical protein